MSDANDERFPISDCCSASVMIEDSEVGFGIVCGRCLDACRAKFERGGFPYIAGDVVPEERLRNIKGTRMTGIHSATVVRCSEPPYRGAVNIGYEIVVLIQNGRECYLTVDTDGTLTEDTPF